jgi:2-polyprenyl-3-methyl-5-hydroxy-6-metoxy-1,4-benzoquinol methylase
MGRYKPSDRLFIGADMPKRILKSTNNDGTTRYDTGEVFNLTHLSPFKEVNRGRFLHRDFNSHLFRWSCIAMYVHKIKNPSILDVGCGTELPLLTVLHSNGCHPSSYLGLDARDCSNELSKHKVPFPATTQICDVTKSLPSSPNGYDIITNLEVIEHMPKDAGMKLLDNIIQISSTNTTIFFSTPCFDPKMGMSKHHIHEYTFQEMYEILNQKFIILDCFGTFISQRDYEDELSKSPQLAQMVDVWKKYYNSALLSNIIAPLFPTKSRNCLWILKNVT